MKRATPTLLALIESFFQQHLQGARGASPHTIRAYRDTLVLFFEFLASRTRKKVEALELADVTSNQVLEFLMHLEEQRGNKPVTRNCRLAALRAVARHLLRHDPSRSEQYGRILAIPSKRCQSTPPVYLEPEQFRLVLDQVDADSPLGIRDAALLLFLYNTGARVSEVLQITWSDLHLDRPAQVRLHGKGNKDRVCLLWKQTVNLLRQVRGSCKESTLSQIFLNSHGQPLTRDGVAYLLRRYYRLARRRNSSLPQPRIHPHALRHSCAVALLQAGIELTVIRDYLGHSSIATTGRYLQTNLAMKRDALRRFWERAGLEPKEPKKWRPSRGLLCFLESLGSPRTARAALSASVPALDNTISASPSVRSG
jgi:integrase/recombinase XerD